MALRVLLADESTTIKKVMQLALQDFAVEVKAVHAGVDVIEVAKAFHPDIIFADVLLQKKNGYEVCSELRNDAQLKSLPIVLMWSSFLEIDERLASRCGADERLEKPFDVETLRQLILKLVPSTRSQRLAHFLDFSQSVTAPMKTEAAEHGQGTTPPARVEQPTAPAGQQPPPQVRRNVPPAVQTAPPSALATPTPIRPSTYQADAAAERSSNWNMDSFEDINVFSDMVNETMMPTGVESEHESPRSHSPIEPGQGHKPGGEFHKSQEAREESGQFSLEDNEDGDEGFSEFKLSDLSRSSPETRRSQSDQDLQNEVNSEVWSHQDLSAFKIDLAPVQVEGEDFALTFNVNDDDVEGTGYTSAPDLQSERDRLHDPYAPDLSLETVDSDNNLSQELTHESSNELALELDDQGLGPHEFEQHFEVQPLADHYQPPRQPMPLEYESLRPAPTQVNRAGHAANVRQGPQTSQRESAPNSRRPAGESSDQTAGTSRTRNTPRSGAAATPRVGRETAHRAGVDTPLTEERLEEIIRAQSQEVIEAVVRRLVPDIATQIIQRELARLLDDSPRSE